MLTLLLTLTVLGIVASAARAEYAHAQQADYEAALKDRATHYDEAEWPYIYYLTLRPHVEGNAEQLRQAIKLVIASDSIQPILERCAPTEIIGTGLLRIDLRDLKWRLEDWQTVAGKRNPYSLDGYAPLVVRADWLLVEMSDLDESDSYYRLIFGGNNIPKTRDDILKFFHAVNDDVLKFGLIEGKSGVSKQGTRRIEFLPILTGFFTRTEDVRELSNERDPLEHPGEHSPFDAEEGIVGLVKISLSTGARVLLEWYYLADGNGKLINKADPEIVDDATHFRGHCDIHNPGSCIQCHAEGLKDPTLNQVRAVISGSKNFNDGLKIFAHAGQQDQLEANLLSDVTTPLKRYQHDFQQGVILTTGKDSGTVADSFRAAVNRYDHALTLGNVTTELETSTDGVAGKIVSSGIVPTRIASLTEMIELPSGKQEPGTVPRRAFEQDFPQSYIAIHYDGHIAARPEKAAEKPKPKAKPPQQNQQYRRKAG